MEHDSQKRDTDLVVSKEPLCSVAYSVISLLGPGPAQTRCAQSYTAKAPATCVRGVATNRRSPGVKHRRGH
jgi:hypothetical protein